VSRTVLPAKTGAVSRVLSFSGDGPAVFNSLQMGACLSTPKRERFSLSMLDLGRT